MPSAEEHRRSVEMIADEMMAELARVFPVCTMSDEFHYFPQALPGRDEPASWDDFSPETLQQVIKKLSSWESLLAGVGEKNADLDTVIDASMLSRAALIIREQIELCRFHAREPTFYLTVACMGLAHALESKDASLFRERARGLDGFLSQGMRNLERAPLPFLELGIEMAGRTRDWLASLAGDTPGAGPAAEAMARFERGLKELQPSEDLLLAPDLYERIVRDHIWCGAGALEVESELDHEIEERTAVLEELARKIEPGSSWREVLANMPAEPLPAAGLVGLYRDAVEDLARHCLEAGLATEELVRTNPVRVAPVPPHLRPVRSAAAYSMPPGRPPRGGTFFILSHGLSHDLRHTLQRDYRLLTAHETWPGHHLLDATRWGLVQRLRRPMEFPLFYEGWACFAEGLLAQTGCLSSGPDLILLNKRHLLRAVRGKVDIGIQTGSMSLDDAARYLYEAGFDKEGALPLAKRYALKPGYQLCYAFGLRKFEGIYGRSHMDPAEFAKAVLGRGEIGFDNLSRILERENR